jgi:hypothetical protein
LKICARHGTHQQPVETVFNQTQDCVEYAEARCITIGPAQKISVAYTKIFLTGSVRVLAADGMKKWPQTKPGPISRLTLLQLAVNTSKCKENLLPPLDIMLPMQPEATSGVLSNLTTSLLADLGVVATLTEANMHLARQLEKCPKDFK